eukprot:gene23575-biopygen4342
MCTIDGTHSHRADVSPSLRRVFQATFGQFWMPECSLNAQKCFKNDILGSPFLDDIRIASFYLPGALTDARVESENTVFCATHWDPLGPRECIPVAAAHAGEGSENTVFCGHRVDPTRDDFYAGGHSKLPAEVPNMDRGPLPGTPKIPQMLEKCTPAGDVRGEWIDARFAQQYEEGHANRRTKDTFFLTSLAPKTLVPSSRGLKGMLPSEPKVQFFVGTVWGDFYAGGPSKLPAEVPNMDRGPLPGTPQIPQMLEKCTPAGDVRGGWI